MIATFLKKSSSINYILMAILTFGLFFLYQYNLKTEILLNWQWCEKIIIFLLLIASIFITDFIAKKNYLTKDSSYAIVLFLFLLIFFPSIFNDFKLLLSNFLIIIALRRLISLRNNINNKEKIFDASLWIFLAAIFHFWAILFIILVFISIILDDFRDYRNWLLPFVALFCVSILFVFYSLVFDKNLLITYLNSDCYSFNIYYFTNIYQNIFFAIYITIALFFVLIFILTLSAKPMVLNSSYKKIVAWFFIGFAVFILSNHKNNGIFLYTISPLALMITNFIESENINWEKDAVLYFIIIAGLFGFFVQL